MRRLVQHLPSPPMAVALLALFVALGGSAYAVGTAAKNSVVAKSIKKGAVTRAKLANNAVNGAKVAPGSLSAADIDVASLQIPGATKYVLRRGTKEGVTLLVGTSTEVNVECLPGEDVVGGGERSSTSQLAVTESIPTVEPNKQGWHAQLVNHSLSSTSNSQIEAYAICAS